MNSDSKKTPNELSESSEGSESPSSNTTSVSSGHETTTSVPNPTDENTIIKGLKDSVDTTIKEVRSKVDPRDLLYYFGIVTTFGVLMVGPFAARYVPKKNNDGRERGEGGK